MRISSGSFGLLSALRGRRRFSSQLLCRCPKTYPVMVLANTSRPLLCIVPSTPCAAVLLSNTMQSLLSMTTGSTNASKILCSIPAIVLSLEIRVNCDCRSVLRASQPQLKTITVLVATPTKTGITPNTVNVSSNNKEGAAAMTASRLEYRSTNVLPIYVGLIHVGLV